MKRLFTLFLVVGLLMPAAAFAQFQSSGSVEVDVTFDELTLGSYDGELTLEYEIDRRSWSQLEGYDVTPRIDIYASAQICDGSPVYEDVELYERSDVLILDHPDFHQGNELRIRYSERRYRSSGHTVRLGGTLSQSVEFAYERRSNSARSHRERSHRDRSHRERSQRDRSHRERSRSGSCDQEQQTRCDREASDNSHVQAHIIEACSSNTNFDSDREQCIQRAANLASQDAVAVIDACGQQTSFGSDFGTCMQTAATFKSRPAPAIHACGEATSFASDFTSCLSSAAKYDRDPSPVVQACGNSTSFSSKVPGCVDDSRI